MRNLKNVLSWMVNHGEKFLRVLMLLEKWFCAYMLTCGPRGDGSTGGWDPPNWENGSNKFQEEQQGSWFMLTATRQS